VRYGSRETRKKVEGLKKLGANKTRNKRNRTSSAQTGGRRKSNTEVKGKARRENQSEKKKDSGTKQEEITGQGK